MAENHTFMGAHRHGQGFALFPSGGEHLLPEGWKIERQSLWTAFWAFFRCANASKLSASGGSFVPDLLIGGVAPWPRWGSVPRPPL